MMKRLADVFSPVRNVKKGEKRKLRISPKGKIISKTAGNFQKMPKGGKLTNYKLYFGNFEKSATSTGQIQ